MEDEDRENLNELMSPVNIELSKIETEALCDIINHPIVRNDVQRHRYMAHEHYMKFHKPLPPRPAPFKICRESLPAFQFKLDIVNKINENNVVLITGATGCGKTTQVPQFVMEECTRSKKPCRIICTQPRRLAAVAVAKRVAYERDESLPGSVGYQVRFEKCIDSRSSLIFMTR